jgi:hypothetical protein
MSLTSTNFNISFNLSVSPQPEFILTDVTDYSAQSVAIADITGNLKITAPSGVVYNGTNDIVGSSSRINGTTILVPLLSGGTPEVGLYSFEYTVTEAGTGDTAVLTKTFNYQYATPSMSVGATVDCLSPRLTGSDNTNYLSGSVSPSDRFSIAGVDTGSNFFSVAGDKTGYLVVGDTFNIINSTANDGEYTVTGVSYDKINDQTDITVASISNATVDGTLVGRKTTLFYPAVLQIADVVGYSTTLQTNTFYSQTHEFLFEARNYYDFGNGISVVDFVSKGTEVDVDCDVRLCSIFCCVNEVFNKYMSYKNSGNTKLAQIALEQYILVTSHLASLRTAFECGDDTAVTNLVNQIKVAANCTDECSCNDDGGEPTPITGLGGAGSVVVQSSGNGVEVATNVSGSTTTYTLSLSESILNSITAASSTSSVSGGTGVSVTSTTVGSNTDYEVSLTTPVVTPEEFMAFNVKIDVASGVASVTGSNYSVQNQSNLNDSTITFSNPDSGAPSFYYYRLRVNSFQNVPNSSYKVLITPYFVSTPPFSNINSNSIYGLFTRYLNPVVTEQKSGEFDIMFIGVGGYPIQRSSISNTTYDKIYFNVQIIE